MARYSNGKIPQSKLIKINSGTDVNGYWEHLITPATLHKWQIALDYARRKWGKVMRVSTGWNCYRPYVIQLDARRRAKTRGQPNSAARAGWSSHGGTWVSSRHTGGRWVDAMAIDVVPQGLSWAQVDEAMRHAGFLVGAITKAIAGMDEPWHYIDLDPWAAVPAGAGGGNASKPKEIRVKTYARQDKPSRDGGRTVAPGDTFKLDDTHGGGGKNIVGGVGPYSIVTHVYAEGSPGDSVEVQLERFARGETPSKHYVERAVFDRNGLVRVNPTFQLDVSDGQRVFVSVTALSTNEKPIKVTLLDSDAYLYTVA